MHPIPNDMQNRVQRNVQTPFLILAIALMIRYTEIKRNGEFDRSRKGRKRQMQITTIGEIPIDMTQNGTVPGFKIKVADTSGAGDTFFGAFLNRIAKRGGLSNLTPDEISAFVRYAKRAASITASRPGAIPAMPTEDKLTEE